MDMGAYEYVVPPDAVALETPAYPRLDEDIIVVNEARTWSQTGPDDWVELHNPTDRTVHIGGWLLTDRHAPGRYEIATGTFLEPHGYLVLYENEHFGNPADPGCHQPFALRREGDTLYLRSGYSGLPTGLRHEQELEYLPQTSCTLGRHIKSDGTVDFVRLSLPTPGEANAHPWVGPVVISEILYSLNTLGAIRGYIELYNRSSASAEVSIVTGDIASPLFVEGPVTVPAQSRVLIADRPDLMQAAYGPAVPPGTEIFRIHTHMAWLGHANPLSLRQGLLTYDTVAYGHGWLGLTSWPTTADGEPLSVTRIDPTRYGNDPNNWQAAAPSPGQ